MEQNQIVFIIAVITLAVNDLHHVCEDGFPCSGCKRELSARLFFQSELYERLLAMLGIKAWIRPENITKGSESDPKLIEILNTHISGI